MKFYKCKVCGQIVAGVKDNGAPMTCCDKPLKEITPQTVDNEGKEKHIPVYKVKKGEVIVQIGSVLHPSTSDHYIEWIVLVTNKGTQRKVLKPGEDPIVTFHIGKDEEVIEIYDYCNIHNLWKLVPEEDKFKEDLLKNRTK